MDSDEDAFIGLDLGLGASSTLKIVYDTIDLDYPRARFAAYLDNDFCTVNRFVFWAVRSDLLPFLQDLLAVLDLNQDWAKLESSMGDTFNLIVGADKRRSLSAAYQLSLDTWAVQDFGVHTLTGSIGLNMEYCYVLMRQCNLLSRHLGQYWT